MEDQKPEEPKVRRYKGDRRCPSCSEPVKRLQLSAYSMPIEQYAIPWLQMMNQAVEWSVRTLGSASLNELQFLAFTGTCQTCGYISWWDLHPADLEDLLTNPDGGLSIAWSSNPDSLQEIVGKIPEQYRKPFLELIKAATPQKIENEPKKL